MKNILKLILFILIAQSAGVIGSLFTTPSIRSWYAGINKPEISPPNWVFAPVWTTLFVLMGISAFLIWNSNKRKPLIIFAVQLVLNVLWSIIFFGMHSPGLAFAEIILLWLAILATIISFWKVSKPAAWLLVPYILWVSFASYLNFLIWRLN